MNSIIEALHTFLGTYPPLSDNRLHVDFLGAGEGAYTIEVVPCTDWVRQYVDGSGLKQFLFAVASRERFDETISRQMENLRFYEQFSDWLAQQSRAGNLPLLGSYRTAIKLETLSSGYTFWQGERTARYQMQCRLLYLQEKES